MTTQGERERERERAEKFSNPFFLYNFGAVRAFRSAAKRPTQFHFSYPAVRNRVFLVGFTD